VYLMSLGLLPIHCARHLAELMPYSLDAGPLLRKLPNAWPGSAHDCCRYSRMRWPWHTVFSRATMVHSRQAQHSRVCRRITQCWSKGSLLLWCRGMAQQGGRQSCQSRSRNSTHMHATSMGI
jgi:hypothetical protein